MADIDLDLRSEADLTRARALLGLDEPFTRSPVPARNKYNAVPEEVDGVRFDSRKEASRYRLLRALLQAGEIADLVCHPSYDLEVNGVLICRYEADFRYLEVATGSVVVEDAKGVRTPAYKLKKKMMKAIHDIAIVEV